MSDDPHAGMAMVSDGHGGYVWVRMAENPIPPSFSGFYAARGEQWPVMGDMNDWADKITSSFNALRDYLDLYGPGAK